MIENEYLDVYQVAYLLGYKDRRPVQVLAKEGKIKAFKSRKKLLIQSKDLYEYAQKKIGRYYEYFTFKEASDKIEYWNNSHFDGLRFADEEKYISCSQMAFLLGISRQSVFKAVRRGEIEVEVQIVNGKERKVIRIENFIEHADRKLKPYERLVDYFKLEDTTAFWEGLENE